MPVFKCVKSELNRELVGATIVAKRDVEAGYITVTRDSDVLREYGIPFWEVGDVLPINGSLWSWEEVKNHED
ncbi:hypothetical protein P4b_00039 [Klebsiella phage VLCpiP4b]|nr:hypothetical protein P4b_00039 [Klebsiella phage VLCpiP4b]